MVEGSVHERALPGSAKAMVLLKADIPDRTTTQASVFAAIIVAHPHSMVSGVQARWRCGEIMSKGLVPSHGKLFLNAPDVLR
jgi:hypothetical protein